MCIVILSNDGPWSSDVLGVVGTIDNIPYPLGPNENMYLLQQLSTIAEDRSECSFQSTTNQTSIDFTLNELEMDVLVDGDKLAIADNESDVEPIVYVAVIA